MLASPSPTSTELRGVCDGRRGYTVAGHFAVDEIQTRVYGLNDRWHSLKDKANQRKQDLEDSLQAHQYFADANEAESWMKVSVGLCEWELEFICGVY